MDIIMCGAHYSSLMNHKGKVSLCLVAVYLIWSSTYLGTYYALQSLPTFIILGGRFFLSGLILLIISLATRKAMPTITELSGAAITGVLMMLGGTGLVTVAQQWVTSGFAAIAVAAVPIWACLLSLMWGQKANKYEWLGIAAGFCGILLLNSTGGHVSRLGLFLLLLAPINWAFGSMLGKKLQLPENLITCAAWQQIFGGIGAFLLSLGGNQAVVWSQVSMQSILGLAFLIVFGGVLAFSAYAYLLKHTRPALATSYAFVNPALAVLLGLVFAKEQVSATSILALLAILGGVALILFGQKKIAQSELREPDSKCVTI